MENYSIDLSAGLKTIELKFADVGESTFIKFNPADLDIARRSFEAKQRIDKAVDAFSKIDFDNLDADKQEKKMIGEIEKVETTIKESLDYAFGNKVSDEVFKYCSPLAVVNGEYYFVKFMDTIAPVIQQIKSEQETEADKKAKKLMAKYEKRGVRK